MEPKAMANPHPAKRSLWQRAAGAAPCAASRRSRAATTIFLLVLGLVGLSFFSATEAAAQAAEEIAVTGTVTDDEGYPLPGVNVVQEGTSNGTVTDAEGAFSLTVPGDATLVFSFVGFERQEVAVDGRTHLDVELSEDIEALEEVVVVGYGSQRRQDVTGAVSSVGEETLKEIPATSVEQAMQGRIPGAVVTSTSAEPGGGLSIRIRGGNSISGNNEPLFVIDGFPVYNQPLAGEFETNQSTNMLANLNPNDIESIEVLKDASATAIYGSRGANGVVLITTKQGREGSPRFTFEHYTAASTIPRTIPLASAYEYALLDNLGSETVGRDPRYVGEFGEPDIETGEAPYFPTPEEIRADVGEGTDWQRELLRTGLTQNYQIGVSGGDNRLKYNLSGSYFDDNGILKNSSFIRYSLRANFFSQLTDRFSVRLNATGSRTTANRAINANARAIGGGPGRAGVVWQAFRANPIARPDDIFFEDASLGTQGRIGFNPLMDLENTHVFGYVDYVLANTTLEYEIFDGLEFTSKNGVNFTDNAKEWFWNRNTLMGYRFNSVAQERLANRLDVLTENYFTYRQDFARIHAVDLTAGMSYQEIDTRSTALGARDFTIDFENGLNKYEFANSRSLANKNRVTNTLLSYYGRANYRLLDRYLFTFTVRADGASKFAANNKWAVFPSGAFAWRFSEEPFLKDGVLSTGKLRLSYGMTGSQAIPPYGSLARMYVDDFGWDGRVVTAVAPLSPGNPNLKWETTEQINAGVDFGFMDDRVNLTANIYRKTTRDLLQQLAVPSESGFSTVVSNFGSIRNEGFELMLGADLLDGPVTWYSSANISKNISEVLDLGDLDFIDPPRGFFPPRAIGGAHRLQERMPLGNFFGYKVIGLLTEEDIANGYPTLGALNKPGMFKFWNDPEDEAGINTINADDKVVLGNALPDYVFGWANNFAYGNFGLDVFVQGMIGHDVLNMQKLISEYGNTNFGVPSKAYVSDYWTPENQDAYYPRPAQLGGNSGAAVITNRLIEDGSFVRLKNVTLSYDLPRSLMRGVGVRNAQLYVTGTNLLTFTGYSGYDPEVSAFGGDNLEPGVDAGAYPRARMYTIGAKLGF